MSDENLDSSAEERAAIERLLAKSRKTDIPALLQAKEQVKQKLRTDPSYVALLHRLDTMLKQAENEMVSENSHDARIFKNVGAVLRYINEEKGRQVKQAKLYSDIKKGLLRKENSCFRQVDVDRYAASLPLSTTPDGRSQEAEALARRKDMADIRIKEAQAAREEKKNAIIDGQYMRREDVYQELAARTVALNTGITSAVRAAALDLIIVVGGGQEKSELLVREVEKIIDAASSEYAKELEFDVQVGFFDAELDGVIDEAEDHAAID